MRSPRRPAPGARPGNPAPILVLGFGPFLDVVDNPASRLARALDGRSVGRSGGSVPVVGREMPVTWHGCVAATLGHAAAHRPRLVLGVGVARGRDRPEVERVGRRRVMTTIADVDGETLDAGDLEPMGPEERRSTLDVDRFAHALGAGLSDDAGGYVCNAWLYQVLGALSVPVGFLHLPAEGIDPERVRGALERLLGANPPSSV